MLYSQVSMSNSPGIPHSLTEYLQTEFPLPGQWIKAELSVEGFRMTESFSLITLLLNELWTGSSTYVDVRQCFSSRPCLLGQLLRVHGLPALHLTHRLLLLAGLSPNKAPVKGGSLCYPASPFMSTKP